MKSRDQLLLEQAYMQIWENKSDNKLQRLIEADQRALDELIEEGFGDFIKKVGSGIKGGAQKIAGKIKETLTSGIASTLVKAIVAAIPKEELDNFVGMIAQGQVPKDKVNQVQQMVTQQPESNNAAAPVAESFYSNKTLLANILFTEEKIFEALQSSNLLLTEMVSDQQIKQAKQQAAQARKQSKTNLDDELKNYAISIGNKIKAMYPKDKQAWATAVPKMATYVSKYLGVPAQTNSGAPASSNNPAAGNASANAAASAGNSGAPASGNTSGGNAGPSVAGATSGEGLVSKVMGFVKKNPKISAAAGAAVLGLVIAAFAGVTPVVVPALLAALKGAGWTAAGSVAMQKFKGVGGALASGGMEAAKQQFKDNKIDVGAVEKAAAMGAAAGGIGKILSIGLGNIAGMFDVVKFDRKITHSDPNYGVGETNTQITQRKGLGSFTGKQSDYITTDRKDTGSWGYQGQHSQMPKSNLPGK